MPKLLGPPHRFPQHGQSEMSVGERWPCTAEVVDDLTFVRSLHTSHFTHGPAQIFTNSGHQIVGRPSVSRG